VRESTGFRGLIALEDRERNTNLVITLSADEESRRASAEVADKLSGLAAEISGAQRGEIREYNVMLIQLPHETRTEPE
jgi:hypothetical protein